MIAVLAEEKNKYLVHKEGKEERPSTENIC